ncbi:MAG: MFS transporter [Sneathiellaceae bacterium]
MGGAAGLLTVLTAMFILGEGSSTMFVPAMPALASQFDVAPGIVQYSLSGYALAFGAATLLSGPLSDRFGRRPVALAGLLLFLAGALVAAGGESIDAVILGRVLQGAGAASGYVVSRAVIRDRFAGGVAARAMSFLFFGLALVVIVAPMAGGQLVHSLGWQSAFLLQAAIAAAVTLASLLLLRESNRQPDRDAIRPLPMLRNYAALFANPRYLAFMAAHACAYAGIMAFLAGGTFALSQIGLDHRGIGLALGIAMGGFLLGSLAAMQAQRRLGTGIRRLVSLSTLLLAAAPAVLLLVGPDRGLSVAVFLALQFAFMFAAGLMAPNTAAGVMLEYPHRAGLAAAMLGSVQQASAAIATVAVTLLLATAGGIAVPAVQAVLGAVAVLAFHLLIRRPARQAEEPGR